MERDALPPENEVDLVRFDDFQWVTLDVTFLYYMQLSRYFAFRFGGGGGIGALFGNVRRTDFVCTSRDLSSCSQRVDPPPDNVDKPYDLPPVMVVLNGVVGFQVRPIANLAINIEGGLRTLPFFGTTVAYYF